MRRPIDMEQKGFEPIGSGTHFVTLNFDLIHDLDIGFSRSYFEKLYPRNGRVKSHGMKGMGVDRKSDWLWTLTSPMTLNLDFKGQIFKKMCLGNGRVDWNGTERMWVDRMLDPLYDLELWPWPCIFKVQFWNIAISQEWDGRLTWSKRKCEWIGH